MSDHSQPIGVFDSGVGGLSVARKIREALPYENILYVADSRHAPYGNKTQQFIEHRSIALAQFMLEHKAKAVVVACNTATLSAIQLLRQRFHLPIIGVEPGIKPAVAQTRKGVVGVMVTTRTSQSENFHQLLSRFADNVRIEVQACEGLVEQVEQGDLASTRTRALVSGYVQALLDKGVDTIALGCTHYPFLMPLIGEIAGDSVTIIETGTAVARQVARRLEEENCLNREKQAGSEHFFSTGDCMQAQDIMSRLWGRAIEVSTCQV